MTIETNGTVAPKETVERATKILMDHYSLILESSATVAQPTVKKEKKSKKISEKVSEEE